MMTMWSPILEKGSQPLYLALADAIERDVRGGQLKAGDRLPTHRDLARSLEVTIGTITRGYQEAQKRGLTTGEVGRGSFIREQATKSTRLTWDVHASRDDVVQMGQNFPVPLPAIEQQVFGPVMRELAADSPSVISAVWPDMLARHQRIGAKWFERYAIDAEPQRVLISTGFQPALWAIISALCEAGDVVLSDQLTTPGLLTLSGALKVRVVGVGGDEQGMSPEALERAIQEHHPRLLYLTPTIQTPTTITMPEARRREIAAITRKHDVLIIEDDDSLPLLGGRERRDVPTVASLAPDSTFLIADVSRALGLGVRLSYVLAPESKLAETNAALTGTTWMPAPMIAEMAARVIAGSGAETIISARRAELAERHAIVRRILPSHRVVHDEAAHHVWLNLPEEWRSESFAAEALRRGVSVNASSTFAVNRAMSPGAVRLCIGAPPTREGLERGLRTLAAVLTQPHQRNGMVI